MPEDEFSTDLEWPTDPFGERRVRVAAAPATAEDEARPAGGLADLELVAARILAALDDLQARLDADYSALRSDVASLRSALDDVLARPPAPVSEPASVASLAPVLEEIDRVREEIASLKRRIGLRAKAQADAAVLTDEQLDRIARTVAGLLRPGTERAR